MSDPNTISYSQMRFTGLKARLVNFLKRWAIYLSIGLIVLGGSIDGTLALMSFLVAPLLQAPQQHLFHSLLICLGYGFVGGLIVLGLSPFLQPADWGEAERALPIKHLERVTSDLLVVILGLLPLIAIYFFGLVVWLIKLPAWLQVVWLKSILLLLTSIGLSIFFGFEILSYRRKLSIRSKLTLAISISKYLSGNLSEKQSSLSGLMALLVLPLLRGYANRSAKIFVFTLVLLFGCVVALVIFPTWGSWVLVGFAVCSQTMTGRLNIELKLEMTQIKEACAYVPVRSEWLDKAFRTFVLIPHLLGILFLCVALTVFEMPIRFSVLSGFLLFGFFGNLALIVSSSKPPMLGKPEDPLAKVSWWLLILAISVALSTEVLI